MHDEAVFDRAWSTHSVVLQGCPECCLWGKAGSCKMSSLVLLGDDPHGGWRVSVLEGSAVPGIRADCKFRTAIYQCLQL